MVITYCSNLFSLKKGEKCFKVWVQLGPLVQIQPLIGGPAKTRMSADSKNQILLKCINKSSQIILIFGEMHLKV